MNIVKIDPKQFGIEEKQAKEIQSGLAVAIEERKSLIGEFEKVSKLEITEENLPAFKELRLRIVKNRTQGIEKWHKTSKEYFLRGGQFVDAIKRKEIQINESMEEKLLEGEKHFERLEKERMQKLKETRVKLLLPYYEDAEMLGLEVMNEDVFNSFLATKKREYEERIEAEKKAEEERIAKEKAEAERVRLQEIENAKLKAEAEKREKEIEAERKRVEAEREKEAIQEQVRKEREKAEAIAKAEAEKRAKLEAELQAKKEAEQKAENERKASEEKAKKEAEKLAKAPIKKQLSVWVNSFELPKSEINNELSKEIESKFDSFKKWSLSQIENL